MNLPDADRHVVLVGTVAAVVDPVAQLILGDALVVGALEPLLRVALEIGCGKIWRCFILRGEQVDYFTIIAR